MVRMACDLGHAHGGQSDICERYNDAYAVSRACDLGHTHSGWRDVCDCYNEVYVVTQGV